MDDFLTRLKKNIKSKNLDPARTLLMQASSRSAHEKNQIIEILSLAPDNTAFELLSFLMNQNHKDTEFYKRLIQLVSDRAHLNFKFVLILCKNADTQTIINAAPLLKHILSNETNKKLLNQIIETAGKIELQDLTDDIAEFIFYDDADLKAAAVKSLEHIGTSAAFEKLEQASKTKKCDQHILDTIQSMKAKISFKGSASPARPSAADKDQRQVKQLASADLHKRFQGFMYFIKKGSKAFTALSKQIQPPFQESDHDLIINILHIASITTPEESLNDIFDILKTEKPENSIKFAAYNALAAFPGLDSAASIIQGLSEPAMFVRSAAVQALEKNMSDFVCAEIKSKIESGTKKAEILAQTILDARAENIIQYLMISDTFSFMASNYLAKAAPIPVIETFIKVLEKRNLKATARKYKDLKKNLIPPGQKPVIIISSSSAVLNVYTKLVYSCGFSCLTFKNPQDAFEAIASQRPCAVICDLFLNDITGVDFARESRELYSKKDLPVIISMLQKNLDEKLLQKELNNAQVNAACKFPPTTSQIKSWIK